MIRFKINGETVAKKNSKQVFVRGGRPIVTTSERYKIWWENAKMQLIPQINLVKNQLPIDGKLSVKIEFFHADNRRRDSDNGLSSILDLLVDVGILVDDRWQIVKYLTVKNEKAEESFCLINIDKIN